MSKNDVFIYDVIGWGDSSPAALREAIAKADHNKPLNVRINSDGGSAFAGFAMFNALKEYPAGVHVYVDGLAASAASVIAMAGDRITMGPMSFVMIHEAWVGAPGHKRELRRLSDLLENIDNTAIAQYAKRTGQTPEQITEWLEAETWFNAQQAVDAGIADEVADEQQSIAFVEIDPKHESGNRWGYKNVPKSLLVDPAIAMQRRVVTRGTPQRDAAERRLKAMR